MRDSGTSEPPATGRTRHSIRNSAGGGSGESRCAAMERRPCVPVLLNASIASLGPADNERSLRISEALALEPEDIDLDAGAIRVLHGEGNRPRTVGIDASACSMVAPWLERRASLGISRASTVFCMADGRRLVSSYVRVMLPRLGRRAAIEKRVHAHGLRHTHAAELRTECLDIGIISKQLGHRSIATTARYLDHIALHTVVEAMRVRSW